MSTLVVYYRCPVGTRSASPRWWRTSSTPTSRQSRPSIPIRATTRGSSTRASARIEYGMSVQFDSTGGDRMSTPLADVER